MSIDIEIHEQPERSRFWATLWVGGMTARQKEFTSPQDRSPREGLVKMLELVLAAYDELVPPPVVAEPEQVHREARGEPPGWVMVPGDNAVSLVATLPYTASDVARWYEHSPALTSGVAVTGAPEEIDAAVAEVDAWTQDKPAPKRRGRPPKKAAG